MDHMIPPQAADLISGFVRRSKEILRDNLTGVYLHGSAAMGCFNPQKSDIDLIVVVGQPLSDPVKREYMDMVVGYNASAPAKGIEMSVVLRNVCKPFVYPTPYELHFSAGHLSWYKNDPEDYIRQMKGEDKDLAAHFTVINKRGVCLYGAPIEEVFAEVTDSDYMDSIWFDVENAEEEITEYPMYLTLNLARVLAYREEGLVLSKKEGGEWAPDHLPAEYGPLIAGALREYTESAETVYDGSLARRYAGYVIKRIRQQADTSDPALTIKETGIDDIENVRRLWADGDVMRFVGFPDGLRKTEDQMREWLRRIDSGRPAVNHYSIYENGVYCGESYYRIDKDHDNSAALDIKLFSFARGRGIASAALSRTVKEAFAHGAETVWVDPVPQNVKAIALYERLGFKKEKTPRHLIPEGEAPASVYMALHKKRLRTGHVLTSSDNSQDL